MNNSLNYASTAQADLFRLQRKAADIQRLADPFPAMVTLRDFVARDLNQRIVTGDCSVYRKQPPFGHAWVSVICIERPSPLRDHYVIHAAEGRSQHSWGGLDQLKVEWHPGQASRAVWKTLSLPMRRALRYLAGDGDRKPRANTLRALEKRGLVADGQATPAGLSLYRLHRKEFGDG